MKGTRDSMLFMSQEQNDLTLTGFGTKIRDEKKAIYTFIELGTKDTRKNTYMRRKLY